MRRLVPQGTQGRRRPHPQPLSAGRNDLARLRRANQTERPRGRRDVDSFPRRAPWWDAADSTDGRSARKAVPRGRFGSPTAVAEIRVWLRENTIRILNMAGPRESQSPGITLQATQLLHELFAGSQTSSKTRRSRQCRIIAVGIRHIRRKAESAPDVRLRLRFSRRQCQPENGRLARLRVAAELSAARFHDRSTDRQTEPQAARLGGKEAIEDSGQIVGVNSGAVVGDDDLGVSVRLSCGSRS